MGPRFDSTVEKKLDAVLDDLVSKDKVPGAVAGVWTPAGGSWVGARGMADVNSRQPMRPDDIMRVGSLTKTYVATVVLQLVDQQRLGLDEPVGRYVSGVPNGGAVTIRQLLNHTSGLFDFVYDAGHNRAVEQNPLRRWKPEELLAISASHEPYFAPGAGWRYSNTNYVVLGMVVEKITGRSIAHEVTRRILDPLRLLQTSYPHTPDMPAPFSRGYELSNGKVDSVPAVDPSAGDASAAMLSNAGDLKTWAEALADGTLLSEEAQQQRLTFVEAQPGGPYFGLGIMKTGDFLGHEGNAFGYSAAMFFCPEKRAAIVVLLNLTPTDEVSAYDVFVRIAQIVFPDQAPVSAAHIAQL